MKQTLRGIHSEIPENLRIEAPQIRESQPAEYPERNFEINFKIEIETPEEHGSHKFSEIVCGPKNFDEREKEVLPQQTKTWDMNKDPGDFAQLDFEVLCNLSKNDKKDTFWETDTRNRRLQRKLFEQDELIKVMNKKITDFDNYLEQLNSERFKVEMDAKLMDIFMITIHQELIILKEFEAIENSLQSKVNSKISEVLDMRDVIREIENQIIEHNKNIEKANDKMKAIQVQFLQAIQDNKFFEFLKKVFRKKYRPPKIRKDDGKISTPPVKRCI